MTTSTIRVPFHETKADAVIEGPRAREAQPVVRARPEPDLESRIKQRRVELIGKLREIRSEASLEEGSQ